MKILYLITKSEIGGAGTHVALLAAGLQRRGHEIALMCPEGWLAQEFLKENKNFYVNNHLNNTLNPIKIFKASVAISKALKDFSPDIVACHSSMAGVLGRVIARLHRKSKVIFTAHSWAFTPGAPWWRKILMIPAEKILARLTDRIICVSFFDKNIAMKYGIAGDKKLRVVYNGVKDSVLRNLERKKPFKIISVMRLDYPKLPELLVEAMSNIDAELLIVGRGAKLNKINELVAKKNLKDKVRVLLTIDRENVAEELAKADLFALVSRHEGLPMTILEAMSVGLPVVASNVGGVGEEVDEACGILVENNTDSIKKAILKIISDEALAKTMSQNAQKKQREVFSLKKFIDETEKIYKETLN